MVMATKWCSNSENSVLKTHNVQFFAQKSNTLLESLKYSPNYEYVSHGRLP